jgi:hypothetical protein
MQLGLVHALIATYIMQILCQPPDGLSRAGNAPAKPVKQSAVPDFGLQAEVRNSAC